LIGVKKHWYPVVERP